jgi:hypothetical protein
MTTGHQPPLADRQVDTERNVPVPAEHDGSCRDSPIHGNDGGGGGDRELHHPWHADAESRANADGSRHIEPCLSANRDLPGVKDIIAVAACPGDGGAAGRSLAEYLLRGNGDNKQQRYGRTNPA